MCSVEFDQVHQILYELDACSQSSLIHHHPRTSVLAEKRILTALSELRASLTDGNEASLQPRFVNRSRARPVSDFFR